MMLTQKPVCQQRRALRSRRAAPFSSTQRLVLRAQKKDEPVAETGRRDFLAFMGLLTSLSAAQAAKAADPYEELKALSEARTGSTSLLESFQGTKGSTTSSRVSRGIREKLAAEAAPQQPASSNPFSFGSSPKPKAAAPVASAGPKPFSFSAPSPKPQASAPAAAPKPAAAAAAGGSGGAGVSAPLIQAAGVLGLVGVGASLATSAATSKPKSKPAASAQPSRAATPAVGGTGKVTAGTGKVKAGTGKVQAAAPSRSSTGKVLAGAAAKAAARPARSSTPVSGRPGTPSLKRVASATGKVKAGAAAVAASGSTVKTVVKQALVNEEAPDQPTDFATGGFLGAVGLLAAFLLFGLPQPQVVAPTSSTKSDPLVEEAKQAALLSGPSYTTPLFKSADAPAPADRKAIAVAPKAAPPAVFAPVLPPKPAVVEAPKPAAPAPAPAVKLEAPKPAVVEAPKPAAPAPKAAVVEAPKPAAVFKAETPKAAAPAAPAAASKGEDAAAEGPTAAQNLLVLAGGIAVVVTAFALTGGSGDSSSGSGEGAAGAAAGTPAAAGATGGDSSAAAAVSAAAEGVSAAASAAAASAPAEGAQQGNAAYDKVVMALMADPEVTEDLVSVISTDDSSLSRNIPALAWSLISTPSNAERLDGFAFQKLPKQRYERVREMLLGAGLSLPDSPRVQAGGAATLAPVGTVDSSEVEPEKLRVVFEALLANPASRTLMRGLLKGAGMPFNEEAFEEQVKDSNYFNLAIAPILRSMPQQKLRVLAELQDPVKLEALVASVSTLAENDQQLQAVTAELSSDVKQTVNTIREAEQKAAAGSTQ